MKSENRKPMWEIKQSSDPAVLDIYVYGDVEADVYDWWNGEIIENNSAEKFKSALEEHPEASQINIYINSYGGDVFEGTAIYNQLRRHPAHKTVYVDGFACSIASVIAMAGDEVVMPKNTMMLVHNMWMCAVGNATELRKAADDLEKINAAGRQAYLAKAGEKLDEAKLVELMDAETWLTAQECVDLGLADRFADDDADLTTSTEMLKKANAGLQQHLAVNKSIAAKIKALTEDAVSEPKKKASDPQNQKLKNLLSKAF